MSNGRLIAIGDIHGCAKSLAALLREIRPTLDDTIVTLGDYIDRGPDSRRVMEQLLLLGEVCNHIALKGNHEELFLESFDGRGDMQMWLHNGGSRTLASYGMHFYDWPDCLNAVLHSHKRFMQDCKLYHVQDGFLFVHASYVADKPLDQQTSEELLWNHIDSID